LEDLKEKFDEWNNFVNTREEARAVAQNPQGAVELREKITAAKSALLRAKAELAKYQAELVLLTDGEPYTKTRFDHEWGLKKAELKAEVEKLIAEQLQAGESIPKLMKVLGSRNPAWFYSIKENLSQHVGGLNEELAQSHWEFSDATSVHRYALSYGPESSDYAFVLMKGAKDTEFEGEQCVFDFNTGQFISGSRAVFESVTESVKKQRSEMLRDLLIGVYTKSVKRDENPYFQTIN
jgi:hypothetical protein